MAKRRHQILLHATQGHAGRTAGGLLGVVLYAIIVGSGL